MAQARRKRSKLRGVAPRRVFLEWAGKDRARAAFDGSEPPIAVDEELAVRALGDATPRRIVAGDAFDVARALIREGMAGRFDLIYLDPPYRSGVDYRHEQRFDGTAQGRVATAVAYRDRWEDGPAAYLDMLYPRLIAMRELLNARGSIWIQVDWRASYLVRMLCDEIYGRDRFLNEIVWRRSPNLGRQARSGQFGRTLDSIIVYGASAESRLTPPTRLVPVRPSAARFDDAAGRHFTLAPRGDYTDASIARLESEGRVQRSRRGTVAIRYWLERNEEGALCHRQPIDALWVDIPPLRHTRAHEKTGYPTQKPEALLTRIIAASTPPGGLVLDLFAGSGTSASAATALGRGFVVGDSSPVAITTMRSRLLRSRAPGVTLERCGASPVDRDAPVVARNLSDGSVELHLLEATDDQPVAWAVEHWPTVGHAPVNAPFRASWHAERGTGRAPAPMPMSVVLPRASQYAARVYFVSGQRAELRGAAATGATDQPSRSLEETT